MSYIAWSVVFGEQPSAAKWNILGANDAAFNNGGGVLALGLALQSGQTGGLQTFNNGGSAGGVGFYVNIGGIKFCWGITGSQTSHNGPTYVINWPTSFFSSIQLVQYSVFDVIADEAQVVVGASAPDTTSASIFFNSITNSSGAFLTASWLAIGT